MSRRCAPTRSTHRATSRATPTATSLGTTIQAPASGPPRHLLEHDRLRQLEDAGRHRSRLHAAPAPHPRQHREGFPVHAGGPFRLCRRRRRSRSATRRVCAGRRGVVPVHAELRAGRHQHLLAADLVAPIPSASTRRARRSTTWARPVRPGDGHLQRAARPGRPARGSTTRTRARCSRPSSSRHLRRRSVSTATRASRTSRRRCRCVYRAQPDKTPLRERVGGGYKAGGFNPASPAGSEAYGEEHTWHVEGGVKTLWASGRVSANAAVFYIDWDDLQLNLPNPPCRRSSTSPTSAARRARGSSSRSPRGRRPASTCSPRVGLHPRALRRRQLLERRRRRRQQAAEHARLHRRAPASSTRATSGRTTARRPRPTRCSTAPSSTTTRTRSGRRPTRSPTSGSA